MKQRDEYIGEGTDDRGHLPRSNGKRWIGSRGFLGVELTGFSM